MIDCGGIFGNAFSNRVAALQLYSNSVTKIGYIVHEIMRGSRDVPRFDGKEALEILVEMGIEKLTRDYLHAFICKLFADMIVA